MASLIHSKNLCYPTFKVSDTLTSLRDKPADKSTFSHPIRANRASNDRKETQHLLTQPNASFNSNNESVEGIISADTTLPTVASPSLKSSVISISHLYTSKDQQQTIRSPIYMPAISLSRYKSLSPTHEDHSTVFDSFTSPITVIDSSQVPNESPKTKRVRKTGKNKSINPTSQDIFDKYLGYLNTVSESSPVRGSERGFEDSLRVKCGAEIVKNPLDVPKYEPVSLVKLPPFKVLNQSSRQTSILVPRDLSNQGLSRNPSNPSLNGKLIERKNSIFAKKKLQLNFENKSQIFSQDSVNTGTLSDIKQSPGYLSPVRRKPSESPNKRQARQFFKPTRPAEHDAILSELAINLHDLYQLVMKNDIKMVSMLENLTLNNTKVMSYLLPTFHKVSDYDATKLEQKFALLEVCTEVLSIPMKLQKKREGITLIDQQIMNEFNVLNVKLEDHNLEKKQENLKLFEDKLMQSQEKLVEYKLRKLADVQKGKNSAGFHALNNFLQKDLSLSASISYDIKPIYTVDEYQKQHGDFKLLNKKNMENARSIEYLFSKFMKQPHQRNASELI